MELLQEGSRRSWRAPIARRIQGRLQAGCGERGKHRRATRSRISDDSDHACGLGLQKVEQAPDFAFAVENRRLRRRDRQEAPVRRGLNRRGRIFRHARFLARGRASVCGSGRGRRERFAGNPSLPLGSGTGERAHGDAPQFRWFDTRQPQGFESRPSRTEEGKQEVQ